MRKIRPELIVFFDQKLSGNALADHAIKTGDARTLLVEVVKVCVGIKEATGRNDGPIIEAMQKTTGGAKGQAWCMYLVQACVAYVEHKLEIKSPLYPSGHCLTVWRKTPKEQRVKTHPLPGAIPIWVHGAGPAGHTEILLGADDSVMKNVGGNTSGADKAGKVTREGNGAYFTTRSMQGFPNIKTTARMKLLGFLKPF